MYMPQRLGSQLKVPSVMFHADPAGVYARYVPVRLKTLNIPFVIPKIPFIFAVLLKELRYVSNQT